MSGNAPDIGKAGENAVKKNLEKRGATVRMSPGSRTSTDIEAVFPDGRVWFVQVKSSSKGEPSFLAPDEMAGLKSRATKRNATPVYAAVRFNPAIFSLFGGSATISYLDLETSRPLL